MPEHDGSDLVEQPDGPPAFVTTGDGSHTLFHAGLNEHFHSRHGALSESRFVYLEEALRAWWARHEEARKVEVFEMGFGTGLNALLAWEEARKRDAVVHYHTVELYPLNIPEAAQLNYGALLPEAAQAQHDLQALHRAPWEEACAMDAHFRLSKYATRLESFPLPEAAYAVVFFDAFAPDKQPHLWTEAVFGRLFRAMRPGAVLTTYSAKGAVRRRMQSVGFEMEKRPGPPGKREMLRAWRPRAREEYDSK